MMVACDTQGGSNGLYDSMRMLPWRAVLTVTQAPEQAAPQLEVQGEWVFVRVDPQA